MTADYRAMCAELVDAILTDNPYGWEDNLHEAANRARALLAQPVVDGLTDEELDKSFQQWWYEEGSIGPMPMPGMDHEEHTKRISQIAWLWLPDVHIVPITPDND